MKANPGKLNYGAPAPSSANALEMHMFLAATGTNAVQIAYKGGAGPAMIGLLGNEVQMMFVTFSSAVELRQAGPRQDARRHLARAQSRAARRPDHARAGTRHDRRLLAGHIRPEGHAEARRGQALSRQRAT